MWNTRQSTDCLEEGTAITPSQDLGDVGLESWKDTSPTEAQAPLPWRQRLSLQTVGPGSFPLSLCGMVPHDQQRKQVTLRPSSKEGQKRQWLK